MNISSTKIKENKKLDGFYLGRETKKIQNHYTKLLLTINLLFYLNTPLDFHLLLLLVCLFI